MSDEREMPGVGQPRAEELSFDESTFLRRVRWQSRLRALVVSIAVVGVAAVIAVAGYMGYLTLLNRQSNRIDAYRIELTALTEPNTWIGGSNTDRQFPGARNTYTAFRPVGQRPLPVGFVTADYDVWGGEVVRYVGGPDWAGQERSFVGDQAAPALAFRYPLAASDRPAEAEEAEAQQISDTAERFELLTQASRARLAAAPASSTVEVAVSFGRLLDYDELVALGDDGLVLNWAAVDAWGAAEAPVEAMPGNMIGVAFIGPDGRPAGVSRDNVADDLVSDLGFIAEYAPEGTANRCLATAEYVQREGVAFYGAVFTGAPAAVTRLLESAEVDAAVVGFIVEDWR